MATPAQIAANQANAQRSTGPRTEEGKTASSRNALKHGLCAERVIIDAEDRDEWEALRADYADRHRPEGRAEVRLVDRIAQVAWRRERGSVMEAAAWRSYARGGWVVDAKGLGKQRWHEDSDPMVAAMAPAIQNGVVRELQRIALYEGRLTRELQRLKAELKEIQKQRRDLAAAERARVAEAAWQARQAAEREAVERRAAALAEGQIPAPEAPPPATAPLAAIDGWARRERARLDAQLRVFRAARYPARETPAGAAPDALAARQAADGAALGEATRARYASLAEQAKPTA